MLDNSFLVPSLCLNWTISAFASFRLPQNHLQNWFFLFRESTVFFEVILDVLGRSVNFNITYRFLLRRPVFPDYPFLVAMVFLIFLMFLKKMSTFKKNLLQFFCEWKVLHNHRKNLYYNYIRVTAIKANQWSQSNNRKLVKSKIFIVSNY